MFVCEVGPLQAELVRAHPQALEDVGQDRRRDRRAEHENHGRRPAAASPHAHVRARERRRRRAPRRTSSHWNGSRTWLDRVARSEHRAVRLEQQLVAAEPIADALTSRKSASTQRQKRIAAGGSGSPGRRKSIAPLEPEDRRTDEQAARDDRPSSALTMSAVGGQREDVEADVATEERLPDAEASAVEPEQVGLPARRLRERRRAARSAPRRRAPARATGCDRRTERSARAGVSAPSPRRSTTRTTPARRACGATAYEPDRRDDREARRRRRAAKHAIFAPRTVRNTTRYAELRNHSASTKISLPTPRSSEAERPRYATGDERLASYPPSLCPRRDLAHRSRTTSGGHRRMKSHRPDSTTHEVVHLAHHGHEVRNDVERPDDVGRASARAAPWRGSETRAVAEQAPVESAKSGRCATTCSALPVKRNRGSDPDVSPTPNA